MANTVIGKILVKGTTQTIPSKNGGNGFTKRSLVIDCSRFDQYTGQQFENYVEFEFTGNKVGELDAFKEGDLVEVSFVLSGRKYEKDGVVRFFNTIVGYKIENYQRSQAQQTPVPPQHEEQRQSEPNKEPQPQSSVAVDNPVNPEDLPF